MAQGIEIVTGTGWDKFLQAIARIIAKIPGNESIAIGIDIPTTRDIPISRLQ